MNKSLIQQMIAYSQWTVAINLEPVYVLDTIIRPFNSLLEININIYK